MSILEKLFEHTYKGLLVSSCAIRFLVINDIPPYEVVQIRYRSGDQYWIQDFHNQPILKVVLYEEFYHIESNQLFHITDIDPQYPLSNHMIN